jgi:hypothetical protein
MIREVYRVNGPGFGCIIGRCLNEGCQLLQYDLQKGKPVIAHSNETKRSSRSTIDEWLMCYMIMPCHSTCIMCVLAPCSVESQSIHLKNDPSLERSWLMELKVIQAFWTRLWIIECCAIFSAHNPHTTYHLASWHFMQTIQRRWCGRFSSVDSASFTMS